jgi:acyl-CoA synthetase (NDP forming)
VPPFSTPEYAVRALVQAVRHARRSAAPPDPPFEAADADIATAATIIAASLGWLSPGDVQRLLGCWGISLVPSRLVASAQAAGGAAEELGGPVALKGVVPGVVDRSEAGAVRLGLSGSAAVTRAAHEMTAQLEAAGTPIEGFQVQPMLPGGTKLTVGAVADPAFGPLVACGAGGVAVELLGDVQVRLAPLGPREADDMLRGLKSFPLLDGYRGRPRAELGALRDLVMRVGALAVTHPAIAELDLSPVIASPAGALVVEARVRVDAPGPEPAFPSLNA